MALSAVYTAIAGDTITAARWNNEFGNIYNNGTDVAFPLTKAVAGGGFAQTNLGSLSLASGKTITMLAGSDYWAKGADIVSAATLPIGVDGNSFNVTGSTGPITSFSGMVAGMIFSLEFDSTPTLTYHATNLILPSSANIVAAAGDTSIWQAITATTARCLVYQRRTGLALVAAAADSDATVTFTDITTNNSSTSNHGFLKKLDNVATNFMNGQGNWAAIAGTLTAGTALVKNPVVLGTTTTQAHGLSAKPTLFAIELECLTANGNWAQGDTIQYSGSHYDQSDTTNRGWLISADATNVNLYIATTSVAVLNKTSWDYVAITVGSWKFTVTPYKVN